MLLYIIYFGVCVLNCHTVPLVSLTALNTQEGFDKGLIEWYFPWKDVFVAKLLFFFPPRGERPWENNWEEVML